METYDPKVNEWKSVASMNTRRSSVGVAVLNGNFFSQYTDANVHLFYSKYLALPAFFCCGKKLFIYLSFG